MQAVRRRRPGWCAPFHRFYKLGKENTRDIIACGFDINKTFIFSNLEYVGTMYPTIVKIEKAITYSMVSNPCSLLLPPFPLTRTCDSTTSTPA